MKIVLLVLLCRYLGPTCQMLRLKPDAKYAQNSRISQILQEFFLVN